ncbi:hypothetical protein HK413_07625 [Mucilaginibacter sp. S1162]|uniref:Two component regulator three Y domain-containing protein n=1 Tax=Mucilaginibacter humi TaxID=2732510 RepID=A0ABX1W318_9SPHI|nr:hypothetical protein [Mucilaginibacter humi]
MLPDQQVNSIAIDKQGIKWIGTANGLLRISGDTWTVYNDQNSGLPSSFILSIAAQDNGLVWIGTNKGLAKFNGTTLVCYYNYKLYIARSANYESCSRYAKQTHLGRNTKRDS